MDGVMTSAEVVLNGPVIPSGTIHVSVEGGDYADAQGRALEDAVRALVQAQLIEPNHEPLQDAALDGITLDEDDRRTLNEAVDSFTGDALSHDTQGFASSDVVDRLKKVAADMPLSQPAAPPLSVSRRLGLDSCICISNNTRAEHFGWTR
jgi:hypothetical protein